MHCWKCQEDLGEAEQFTSWQAKEQREGMSADFHLPKFSGLQPKEVSLTVGVGLLC